MRVPVGLFQVVAGSVLAIFTCAGLTADPVQPASPADEGDIPAKFEGTKTFYDFEKREVMIPMRDGVKLFTIIVIPKSASHAPIILDRTPYSAAKFVSRAPSPHMALALPTSLANSPKPATSSWRRTYGENTSPRAATS